MAADSDQCEMRGAIQYDRLLFIKCDCPLRRLTTVSAKLARSAAIEGSNWLVAATIHRSALGLPARNESTFRTREWPDLSVVLLKNWQPCLNRQPSRYRSSKWNSKAARTMMSCTMQKSGCLLQFSFSNDLLLWLWISFSISRFQMFIFPCYYTVHIYLFYWNLYTTYALWVALK